MSIMSSRNDFKDPLNILIYLLTLVAISPQLTFCDYSFPITGYLIARIGSGLRRTSDKGQRQMETCFPILKKTLAVYGLLKFFMQKKIPKDLKKQQRYSNIMTRLLRKKDLSSPMSEFLST